jgi:hypothetical protein
MDSFMLYLRSLCKEHGLLVFVSNFGFKTDFTLTNQCVVDQYSGPGVHSSQTSRRAATQTHLQAIPGTNFYLFNRHVTLSQAHRIEAQHTSEGNLCSKGPKEPHFSKRQ